MLPLILATMIPSLDLKSSSDVQSLGLCLNFIPQFMAIYNLNSVVPFMYHHDTFFYREKGAQRSLRSTCVRLGRHCRRPSIYLHPNAYLHQRTLLDRWPRSHCMGRLLLHRDNLRVHFALHIFRKSRKRNCPQSSGWLCPRNSAKFDMGALQRHCPTTISNPRVLDLDILYIPLPLAFGRAVHDAATTCWIEARQQNYHNRTAARGSCSAYCGAVCAWNARWAEWRLCKMP